MSKTSPAKPDLCLQFADCVGLGEAAAKGLNFVFSPLSIRVALSLAAAGANGPTLDQFLSFLGSNTLDDLYSATEKLLASVRTSTGPNPNPREHGDGDGECSHVSLANSMWVDETVTLNQSFKETTTHVYDAETRSVDFRNQAPRAAEEVNAWIESKTNGLIKDLIPPDALSEFTTIILANALYFKGPWVNKFDYDDTRDDEFHLLDGSSTRVPFMRSGCPSELVAVFDGFKVLELRYQPNQARLIFSMLIFLPDARDGLGCLVQNAVSDSDFFSRHAPTRAVDVGKCVIPKFRISCRFQPSDYLPNLGLEAPFDTEKADFEEMALLSHSDLDLSISCVRHKATIEVTEEGTEASAATVVEFEMGYCLLDDRPPTVDFVADHPFMFLIREERTGAVLFFGHVVNPSVEETSV